MTQITTDAPVFVAGHGGLVGSAVLRALEEAGPINVGTGLDVTIRELAETTCTWFLDDQHTGVSGMAETV